LGRHGAREGREVETSTFSNNAERRGGYLVNPDQLVLSGKG